MQKLLSVSQLNRYIKGVFEDELILHSVAVVGEVCDYSIRGNNAYFTLRDETDRLSCVYFKYNPNFIVCNGMSVKAIGSCVYYTKGGRMSFNVTKLEQFGEGGIALKKKLLYEKLKLEGVFDTKKPMPKKIRTIGVVTSVSGAVMHDIITVVTRRDKSVNLIFFDARVQGEGADKKICNGIDTLAKHELDAIIIARGGGAGEDLDVFNSELIARKIASCNVFTVSAIGHETDTTMADYASDLRAPTPSSAAELLTVDNSMVLGNLKYLARMLNIRFFELYQRKLARFNNASKAVKLLSIQKLSATKRELLQGSRRLYGAIKNKQKNCENNIKINSNKISLLIDKKMQNKSQLIEFKSQLINKLNPLKILERGYAKVFYQNKPISSLNELEIGKKVEIYMADGLITSTIENKKKYNKKNNNRK